MSGLWHAAIHHSAAAAEAHWVVMQLCRAAGGLSVSATAVQQRPSWETHAPVPWSLVLWAFSKHHRLDWYHPASHYSATQIQFGFQIQSSGLNYLHTVYSYSIVNIQIIKLRCGHICHLLAKFQNRNSVIPSEINTIRRFGWGWFCSSSDWPGEFTMLTNRKLHGLKVTSVWAVLNASLHYWQCLFNGTCLLLTSLKTFKNIRVWSDFTLIWYESGL